MALYLTTVFGFAVAMAGILLTAMHFIRKECVTEHSTIIDPLPNLNTKSTETAAS